MFLSTTVNDQIIAFQLHQMHTLRIFWEGLAVARIHVTGTYAQSKTVKKIFYQCHKELLRLLDKSSQPTAKTNKQKGTFLC